MSLRWTTIAPFTSTHSALFPDFLTPPPSQFADSTIASVTERATREVDAAAAVAAHAGGDVCEWTTAKLLMVDAHPTAGWTIDVRAVRNPWARRTAVGVAAAPPNTTVVNSSAAGGLPFFTPGEDDLAADDAVPLPNSTLMNATAAPPLNSTLAADDDDDTTNTRAASDDAAADDGDDATRTRAASDDDVAADDDDATRTSTAADDDDASRTSTAADDDDATRTSTASDDDDASRTRAASDDHAADDDDHATRTSTASDDDDDNAKRATSNDDAKRATETDDDLSSIGDDLKAPATTSCKPWGKSDCDEGYTCEEGTCVSQVTSSSSSSAASSSDAMSVRVASSVNETNGDDLASIGDDLQAPATTSCKPWGENECDVGYTCEEGTCISASTGTNRSRALGADDFGEATVVGDDADDVPNGGNTFCETSVDCDPGYQCEEGTCVVAVRGPTPRPSMPPATANPTTTTAAAVSTVVGDDTDDVPNGGNTFCETSVDCDPGYQCEEGTCVVAVRGPTPRPSTAAKGVAGPAATTPVPSVFPTYAPSTLAPSTFPTYAPSTLAPSTFPTYAPSTLAPSTFPTYAPSTLAPSTFPTYAPTASTATPAPSAYPLFRAPNGHSPSVSTPVPTAFPTYAPSTFPTYAPTAAADRAVDGPYSDDAWLTGARNHDGGSSITPVPTGQRAGHASNKPTPLPTVTPAPTTTPIARAAEGNRSSVAIFEEKIDMYNAGFLGCNSGWSRYLDWHIAVWCADSVTLDEIGPKLCAAGAGFHAHASSQNPASKQGSIWTGGVGGLGVEFHMKFDWTFFNHNYSTLLDYCSADSTGICSEDSCDLSDLF